MSVEGRRAARFAVVGVGNTVITLALYALLVSLGIHYAAAAAIAWSAGALNGYSWNRIWTFSRAAHRATMMGKYLAVAVFGLSLNTALLALLVAGLGAGEFVGEIVALPIVVLTTFSLNRHWTFGPHLRELAASRASR